MELHNYQKYAAEFICRHPASAILLDCGCGKTVITLTAIAELLWNRFETGKVLVICPIRVAQVWREEIEKWEHLKGLKISLAVGTAAERRRALNREADIYVINRENVQWLVENCPWRWDMLVIDELSSFKNHAAKRFRALMRVRPKVKRIVGLTGTPTGNGLMDLWAEYRLLDMGERLGKFIGAYRQLYFRPDKTNGFIVYSYKPLRGAEEKIYKKISEHDGLNPMHRRSQNAETHFNAYRQAVEYFDWFGPAWEQLSEDDRYVLEEFFLGDGDAPDEIARHFNIERSSAYVKRKRAVERLSSLLYGRS